MATKPAAITVGLHAVNNVTTRLAKADPGATVSQFATVAQSAFGISPEELVVYFNGHEIDQSAALAAAGVSSGAILHLLADIHGEDPVATTRDTHEMFRDYYVQWHSSDKAVVLKAVKAALLQIKASKSHRPIAAVGSGVEQMKFLLRKYAHDVEIQQLALRFMAEAAIDPKTELKVFDAGGTDIAMAIGRQTSLPLDTRGHAARFFFNLTYTKHNRMSVVNKGGLDHIAFLALDEPCNKKTGTGMKLLLSTSKALVMLANVPAIRPLIMDHPRMRQTILVFAVHSDKEVWLRAAKVIKALAGDAATLGRLKKWDDVTASLFGMDDSNAFVKDSMTLLGMR